MIQHEELQAGARQLGWPIPGAFVEGSPRCLDTIGLAGEPNARGGGER
jgi:hypothetical protein